LILLCAAWFLLPAALWAAEGSPGKAFTDSIGLAYIGAGVAVGFACLASGYAVAKIGSSAIGAVSENRSSWDEPWCSWAWRKVLPFTA